MNRGRPGRVYIDKPYFITLVFLLIIFHSAKLNVAHFKTFKMIVVR